MFGLKIVTIDRYGPIISCLYIQCYESKLGNPNTTELVVEVGSKKDGNMSN